MGLPVSVLVRGPQARSAAAAAIVEDVYAELRRVDAVFSTYRPDSQVSRLARGELSPEDCDDDVRTVLRLCEQARTATSGWFDHELPGADGRRRLDPSGLVKGWAAERAAQRLGQLTGHDWLLNAGGDVVVSGRTRPFRVGIQSPREAGAVLDVVEVAAGGVATSGAYQRGGHVLDPHTGLAATSLASVTVVGPTLMAADVLATAAFAQGPAALPALEGTAGFEALAVLPDGQLRATSGWPGALRARP